MALPVFLGASLWFVQDLVDGLEENTIPRRLSANQIGRHDYSVGSIVGTVETSVPQINALLTYT